MTMTEDVASLLVASLENVVLDASQLRDTPSAKDGVPSGLEYDLRLWGCGFIQELGLCLRMCACSRRAGMRVLTCPADRRQ